MSLFVFQCFKQVFARCIVWQYFSGYSGIVQCGFDIARLAQYRDQRAKDIEVIRMAELTPAIPPAPLAASRQNADQWQRHRRDAVTGLVEADLGCEDCDK